MKFIKNLFSFMALMNACEFATAQDRIEDISSALNSLNENNRYTFSPYLSPEAQSQAPEYLKDIPSDCDGRYVASSEAYSKDFDPKKSWRTRPSCHLNIADGGQFLFESMRKVVNDLSKLPCIGRDYISNKPDIRVELRVDPGTSSAAIHQDGGDGSHAYRAILMLQGAPTLFYNTSNIEDAIQGKIEADQAPDGAIALFKTGAKPNQFGAIHAGPTVNEVKARVMIVVEFFYGCNLDCPLSIGMC